MVDSNPSFSPDSSLKTLGMESRPSKSRSAKNSTRRDLMIQTWQRLGCSAVGKRELREIQQRIAREDGKPAVESPATIARILADEGAELRHPEVIEFDAEWREAQLKREAARFEGLLLMTPVSDLEEAEKLILKLEELRARFTGAHDRDALQELRRLAGEARQSAAASAKNDPASRYVQLEIAEWITLWMQNPAVFKDWLDLRRRSSDFRKKFGEG
jgi:hypothetical protein